MLKLPAELSLSILKYLNFGDLVTLSRTNLSWRCVLSKKSNWSNSVCVIGNGTILGSDGNVCCELDEYSLMELQLSLKNVKFVTVDPMRTFNDMDGELLFPYLNSLQSIDLKDTSISDSSIQLLARSCPHLKSLNIERCHNITEKSLVVIGKQMELESLNISSINCISNKSWLILCVFSKMLTHITMRNCMYCEWDILSAIIPKSLRYWDISNNYGVGYDVLHTIIKTRAMDDQPYELQIHVQDCDMLTRDEIQSLEERCPLGSKLKIMGNPKLKNHNEDGVREYLSMLIGAQ